MQLYYNDMFVILSETAGSVYHTMNVDVFTEKISLWLDKILSKEYY